MTGIRETNIAVAKRYFSAVNETRLDDLVAVFAEDGVLSFPMLAPLEGRKAIRDFYAGVLEFYPKRHDDVTRWFVSDSGDVAAEISFAGSTATGREVAFDAIDVFTIKSNLIHRLTIYYDSAKVMQMLGEFPK